MLGRSVTFGPKSVEKCFQQQNVFELTTPSVGLVLRVALSKKIFGSAEQALHG